MNSDTPEQHGHWPQTLGPNALGLSSGSPAFDEGIICGFWRRLGAFVLDWIILGVPLEIIGWIFFDRVSRLGDWGALVGISIAIAYFGVLGSARGGGQTVGMRLAGIRVVDSEGKLLTISRSVLRYAILWVPLALNGAALPAVLAYPLTCALILLIYMYVFNRRTRQSLHDLAAGSFVVIASTSGRPNRKRIWRGHWAIATGGLAAILVAAIGLSPWVKGLAPFPELLSLQHAVMGSGKVNTAGVQALANWTNGRTTHSIVVTAVWRGRPQSPEEAATELARIALQSDPNLFSHDLLQISIRTEFNLGLATGNLTSNFVHTPSEWKQLVSTGHTSSLLRSPTDRKRKSTRSNLV